MRETLAFLWKCSRSSRPMVAQTWLDEQPTALRVELLSKGYLVKSNATASSIRVNGELCEVIATLYSSGETKFFYHEDGRPCEVDPSDLRLYDVCFTPLQNLLHDGLTCGGVIQEVVPGLLWKVGTAGQQRREVYLARNWGNEPAVQKALASVKKGSLIFRFGCNPVSYSFDEAQVYEIQDMLDWVGDELVFDARAVFDNLKDMVAGRPQRRRKKRQPKQTEHQQRAEKLLVAWFRYKYEKDKRLKHGEPSPTPSIDLQFTDQQSFAQQLEIPKAAVTRMKKVWEADLLGNGYAYKLLLDILGKDGPDYFLDFYNQHKDRMRKIDIEY